METSINQHDFERIERYLLNRMPDTEKQEFEKELAEKLALKQELELERYLMLTVEAGALKEDLESIHKSLAPDESRSMGRYSRSWLAIAAGIAAFVVVGIWALNRPQLEERLYAEYATVDPGLPVPMSADANYSFHDAMVDYKAEKYGKAIEKWSVLLAGDPDNDTLNYYLASAYFNEGNHGMALPLYDRVTKMQESSFVHKAQWYGLLSLLKLDRVDEAISISPLPDSPYKEEIESIKDILQK